MQSFSWASESRLCNDALLDGQYTLQVKDLLTLMLGALCHTGGKKSSRRQLSAISYQQTPRSRVEPVVQLGANDGTPSGDASHLSTLQLLQPPLCEGMGGILRQCLFVPLDRFLASGTFTLTFTEDKRLQGQWVLAAHALAGRLQGCIPRGAVSQ